MLLHGYRFPQHEAAAAAIAVEVGFAQVSVSHRVMPLPKLVVRGDTTLVDAYLSPVLGRYVASVRQGLHGKLGRAPLTFMQSHGGLAAADHFHGKDSLLSGPAGGVIGMIAAARAVGVEDVIGFDMGGTSTDVALYAGELERTTDAVIAAVRISAPMLKINTVAAGGGSILKFGNGRLTVGPDSAGAFPGPACYRHGGPLTVTDANLLLGRIQPDFFPRVFGRDGDEPLDTDATAAAFAALAATVAAATGAPRGADELAAGFLRIAVERMANAIKQISVQRGHDVTRFALCCFGGAGGQHAAQVADALGVRTVLIHPLAGVLSAYGIGVAALRVVRQESVEAPLEDALLPQLARRFGALRAAALAELRAQGDGSERATLERRVRLKVAGTDTSLGVAFDPDTTSRALRSAFDELHVRHFGFRAEATARVLAESIELEAVVPSAGSAAETALLPRATAPPARLGKRRVWCADGWHDAPVYERGALLAGATVRGPALIVEAHATTVVEPGWRATVHANGTLLLTRAPAPDAPRERRDRGRSGHARGVQQSVHARGRGDGHRARAHGAFREHQGTARLLLRPVRRRWLLDRQRAAHPRAPGLDGRYRAEHPACATAWRRATPTC